MVAILKKELSKTNNANELEDMDKYRQLLVRCLHGLSLKFPDISSQIIPGNFTKFQALSLLF
jgi:hypothetical protein